MYILSSKFSQLQLFMEEKVLFLQIQSLEEKRRTFTKKVKQQALSGKVTATLFWDRSHEVL